MKKNILTKVRRWDENIGKLIVFAVTIIIAVGVLGTLAYFYNQSRENATKLSVLTSTTSNLKDLQDAGFCKDDATEGKVVYQPIKDQYTLYCYSGSTGYVDSAKIEKVKGITTVSCPTTWNSISGAACVYKLSK
jgi:hypothetical protein